MLMSLNFVLVSLAKPKSAILAVPLLIKMFDTFISLWTMPKSARYMSPLKMSLMYASAYSSRMYFLVRNFDYRSPSLHYSVTM